MEELGSWVAAPPAPSARAEARKRRRVVSLAGSAEGGLRRDLGGRDIGRRGSGRGSAGQHVGSSVLFFRSWVLDVRGQGTDWRPLPLPRSWAQNLENRLVTTDHCAQNRHSKGLMAKIVIRNGLRAECGWNPSLFSSLLQLYETGGGISAHFSCAKMGLGVGDFAFLGGLGA